MEDILITYHVVQSFERSRKGGITADEPMAVQTAEQARRAAGRLSASKFAVVAFSRTGDPATGDYEDAVVLAQFGGLPEDTEYLKVG